VKLSGMVKVLPHRALHSITKHLSGILKFCLTFSQMQCKPRFKHCHSTVFKCFECNFWQETHAG